MKSIKQKKDKYDPYIYFSYSYFFYLLINRPDIIVCTGFSPATIISFVYSKLFGKKYIIWNEGTEHTERNISNRRLKLRRFLSRHAKAFVIAGEFSRVYIQKVLNKDGPFFLSYNCNDTSLIQKTIEPNKRTSLGFNLMYSGNLVKSKGVMELMSAFQEIKNQNNEYRLFVIGSGPLEDDLQQYVSENNLKDVFFVGFIPFEKSLEYWKRADVLIHLCHFDYNPLVLTEALAAGLPVVCSKYAGSHPDFVHEGKNGYVVDPFDPQAVAEAVKKCIENNRDGSMTRYALQLSEKLTYDNAAKGFIDAIKYAYNN